MNKAEALKMKIASTIINAMVRNNIGAGDLGKEVRVAKHRVESLINPSDTSIDLSVLCKVCDYLRIRLTVRNRGRAVVKHKPSDKKKAKTRVLGSVPSIGNTLHSGLTQEGHVRH